ncbi:MAG: DNA-3-methyladenine glycosylase [bacterium]
MSTKLERDFYLQPTLTVACDLLGKLFVVKKRGGSLSGRIVETEAYIGQDDLACHARSGRTRRNWVMFEQGGLTYVYFVYGMYNMLNIVAEPKDAPAAVLIRALEPVDGIKAMQRRRGTTDLRALTSGPGKLCQALGITVADSGRDLTENGWHVIDDGHKVEQIGRSGRIGIREATEKLWRFYDEESRFVSGPKSVQPRRTMKKTMKEN